MKYDMKVKDRSSMFLLNFISNDNPADIFVITSIGSQPYDLGLLMIWDFQVQIKSPLTKPRVRSVTGENMM